MAENWVTIPASDVKAGDRVRFPTGREFDVARVDHPFLGRDELVCLIESNDERWFAQPAPLQTEVLVRRDA